MGCYIAAKGYLVRPKVFERHRISHGGLIKRAFTEELLMMNSEGCFKVLISNYY